MTTQTTATDAPPEKKKKERKPRATSKYIVVNVLDVKGIVAPLSKEDTEIVDDALDILGLNISDFLGEGKRQLAIIEGDPHNGIIEAREYVETNGVAGKRILIACVRRDGSATPVNGVELKGL